MICRHGNVRSQDRCESNIVHVTGLAFSVNLQLDLVGGSGSQDDDKQGAEIHEHQEPVKFEKVVCHWQ